MKNYWRIVLSSLVVSSLSACIVDQQIGSRDDSGSPADSAMGNDATPMEDSATRTDTPPTPDVVPTEDTGPTRDAGPDGTTPPVTDVSSIELRATRLHLLPAISPEPVLSVGVTFRSAPAQAEVVLREVARGGDCQLRQMQGMPLAASSALEGLAITATMPDGSSVALTRSSQVGQGVIADFTGTIPGGGAPGARVRLSVGATSSIAAFTREIEITDLEFAAPTPVTESASARYVTWTRGADMPVAWRRLGTAATAVGWSLNLFTPSSETYLLSCTASATATSLTVPTSVMSALYDLSPSMGAGGVTTALTGAQNTEDRTAEGVRLTLSSGSVRVGGTRW